MTAIVDTVGLAHLVAVVERCRRDWDPPGIRTILQAELARHTYAKVADVATATARDPSARTPGAIQARLANGWTGQPAEPLTRTPTRAADMRCPRCNAWLVDPAEVANHNCRDRADPDHARAMRDHAKAAAKTAPRPTAKETT